MNKNVLLFLFFTLHNSFSMEEMHFSSLEALSSLDDYGFSVDISESEVPFVSTENPFLNTIFSSGGVSSLEIATLSRKIDELAMRISTLERQQALLAEGQTVILTYQGTVLGSARQLIVEQRDFMRQQRQDLNTLNINFTLLQIQINLLVELQNLRDRNGHS